MQSNQPEQKQELKSSEALEKFKNEIDVLGLAMAQGNYDDEFRQLLEAYKKNKLDLNFLKAQFDRKSEDGVPAIWYLANDSDISVVFFNELIDDMPDGVITSEQLLAKDKETGTNTLFWLIRHYQDGVVERLINRNLISREQLAIQPHFKKEMEESHSRITSCNNKNLVEILITQILQPNDEEEFNSALNILKQLITNKNRLVTADLINQKIYDDIYSHRTLRRVPRDDLEIYPKLNQVIMLLFMVNQIDAKPNKKPIRLFKDEDKLIAKPINTFNSLLISMIRSMHKPSESMAFVTSNDNILERNFLTNIMPSFDFRQFIPIEQRPGHVPDQPNHNFWNNELAQSQIFKDYIQAYIIPLAHKERLDLQIQSFCKTATNLMADTLMDTPGGYERLTDAYKKCFHDLLKTSLEQFFTQNPLAQINKDAQKAIMSDIIKDVVKETTSKQGILSEDAQKAIMSDMMKAVVKETTSKQGILSEDAQKAIMSDAMKAIVKEITSKQSILRVGSIIKLINECLKKSEPTKEVKVDSNVMFQQPSIQNKEKSATDSKEKTETVESKDKNKPEKKSW